MSTVTRLKIRKNMCVWTETGDDTDEYDPDCCNGLIVATDIVDWDNPVCPFCARKIAWNYSVPPDPRDGWAA